MSPMFQALWSLCKPDRDIIQSMHEPAPYTFQINDVH